MSKHQSTRDYIEAQQNLAACDALPDDIKAAADRLRALLAPAA